MKQIINILKEQKIPLMFSIAMSYWTMSSMFGTPILGTMGLIILLHSMFFVFFTFVAKMGTTIRGGIYFILFSGFYFMVVYAVIYMASITYYTDYFLWIVELRPGNNDIGGFWFGTVLLSAYGFCSTVFYFTYVRFRMTVLFLVGIIPFMMHSAKAEGGINVPFLLFIILFFVVYIERSKMKGWKDAGGNFSTGLWYTIAMMLFVFMTLIISIVSPKPDTIPKIAYIDTVLNQTIQPLVNNAFNNNVIKFNSMMLKAESFIGSQTAPLGEEILFYVKADEPLYLKIQSWDKYRNNKWIIENKSLENGYEVDFFSKRHKKLEVLTSMFDKWQKAGLSSELLLPNIDITGKSVLPKENEVVISTNGVQFQSFLNPPGLVDIKTHSGKRPLLNENGCFFMNNGEMPGLYEKYTLKYVSGKLSPVSKEYRLVTNLDKTSGENILNPDMYMKIATRNLPPKDVQNLELSNDERDILFNAKREMEIAYSNYTELPSYLPTRIWELAADITAGKSSDFLKAKAIENFFKNSGFKYSLKVPAMPKGMDYNDFFIFESKKGVCVQFASSMVILARAAGLPARYVEGFSVSEFDNERNSFVVREKHSHAFPEVYIAGYGWMVFEPTISGNEGENVFSAFFTNLKIGLSSISLWVRNLLGIIPYWVKIIFIPFIVLSIFYFMHLLLSIRRFVWLKFLKKHESHKTVLEIYKKISNLLKKVGIDIKKHETPLGYSLRVSEECGICMDEFADILNKSKYGGIKPSCSDIKKGIDTYREVLLYVKKRKGKIKSWIV